MYQYIATIPNKTYFGVSFSDAANAIQYQIWYNYTLTINKTSDGQIDPLGMRLLSLVKGIDEAIISVFGDGGDADLSVTLKDWPEIPSPGLSNRVISQFGKFFIFCASVFVFMTGVNQVMFEKESKLRISMEYMGLDRSIYWISWFLTHSVYSAANSLSIYLFGLIFQFLTFRNTNFLILFGTLWIFSMSMMCMGYLITSFTNQAKTAILISIVTFVCGLIFQVIIFSDGYIAYIWWDAISPPILKYIFYCLPFFNFGKLLFDISSYSEGRFDPITEMVVSYY